VVIGVVGFQEVQRLDRMWAAPETASTDPAGAELARTSTSARVKGRLPLAAAAAVGSVALLVLLRGPAPGARPVDSLLDAAGGKRMTESRIAGELDDRRAADPALVADEDATLIAVAARLQTSYSGDVDAESRRVLGVAALFTGAFDDAIAHLSMAAATEATSASLASDLAAAYYERARRLSRPDDLPRALSTVERALRIEPDHREALFNRALILSRLGVTAAARAAWDAYLQRDSRSAWAAQARVRLQALSRAQSRPTWAVLHARLRQAPSGEAAAVAVRLHARRAREYLENDVFTDWALAVQRGETGVAQLDGATILADAFVDVAGDHVYRDAIDWLRQASTHAERRQALATGHLAFAEGMRLLAIASFATAAPKLRVALAQFERAGSPLTLRTRIEVAGIHYYLRQYDAATAGLHDVKALAEARRYAASAGRAAWLEGLIAQARHDYVAAQRSYEEMLSRAEIADDVEQQASARALLANLHWTLGETAAAWQYRIDANSALEDIEHPQVLSLCLLSAAGDAASTGNHGAALVFESALLARAGDLPSTTRAQTLAQHARTMSHLGAQQGAVDEVARARALLAEIDVAVRERVEGDVLLTEAQIWRDADAQRAIAAARRGLALPSTQRDPGRVATLNLHLAYAAVRTGDLATAEGAVAAGVTAFETWIGPATGGLGARSSDPLLGLYLTGIDVAMRRGDIARAFSLSEQRRARRFHNVQPHTLAEVQAALPHDTAVIVFTQVDAQLHLWTIRRDDVSAKVVEIAPNRAESLVASHLNEVRRSAVAAPMSAALFETVLRPALLSLDGVRNVAIVADAPFNRIAAPAFLDRRVNRFLVEDYAIVSAPSAAAYVASLERVRGRRSDTRRAAIIEAPDAPRVGAEGLYRSQLASLYAAAQMHRNAEATPARLRADVREQDVIHVVAAVRGNHDYPSLSRLVLADMHAAPDSGLVLAQEIASPSGPNAALIAVDPPAQASLTDGGVTPLMDALLAAGVPNLVGPIATVAPSSLNDIWLRFHRHYASGLPAAESLRQAQLAALRASERRPGPWALLTVFGSTQ
jgi:tetratricopeptide (TPR) repeat protein